MGCSKNLVDSERLLHSFAEIGFKAHHNPERLHGDVVVINTCGFISDAQEESINMVLECCRAREEGKIKRVYVMGCLTERFRDELAAEIPEVDGWYGKFDWVNIISDLAPGSEPTSWHRTLTTPGHYAYLKISEGCNRRCAFCAIPLSTGSLCSRPLEEIVDEARALVAKGVKEINVIAQELTSYGLDLYGRRRIADLIDALAGVEGIEWLRLHYAYPTDFPEDMLDAMARNSNVCRYLDIALQHISDRVLNNMHRHINGQQTRALLQKIRDKVPGIVIRTTLMVGFPGEEEEDFNQLLDFVREQRFDRMGAFAYSPQEGTFAFSHFDDTVPEEVKQQRLDRLMSLQESIAAELAEQRIGSTMRVIVDSENEDCYVCRSEFDSPEVDPEILVEKSRTLRPGDMVDVRITSAEPFELFATPV